MTTSSSPSVILIPAYEPGEALIDSTSQLLVSGFTVVVVDDGSEAAFQPIFARLHPDVHVIAHSENKGKGAALKTGYHYIRDTFGECVIITADADGQHTVDDIAKVARAYTAHPGALLLGARTFEASDVPLRSKFGNELTRKVFSLITRQSIGDTQTGLRAFDSSLITFMLAVPGERFEYEMNVLLACSRAGIAIAELPIQTVYENNNETSHFHPIKDSIAIYSQVLKFTSSSLLSFGFDYLLFILLVHLTGSWGVAASVAFANVVARLVSASVNFTINKRVVFKHKGKLTKGIIQYTLLAGILLFGNTVLLGVLTSGLQIVPWIAKIITEIAFFFVSYFVQKHLIFTSRVPKIS